MAPYITLFGRTAGSYGLCSVLGLLVSGFVAIRLGRRRGVPSYLVIQAAVSALVGLLVGGHLLYGLLHLPERLTQPALVTFLRCFSGSVYYGGFLGACLSVHWYARHFAPNQTGLLTDLFACAVPLFHAFGRVGCFLAGCCYGIPAPAGWGGVTFSQALLAPNGVALVPVQLYEAAGCLLLFLLLDRLARRGWSGGQLLPVYLSLYGAFRFLLEFLRGDGARGFWGPLSTSQWVALATLAVALPVLLWQQSKRNHQRQP